MPPIVERKHLRYSKQKMESYFLNLNHPKGGAKAKFFIETLGYSKDNSMHLHNAIYEAIKGKSPTKTENTQYGVKHTYHTKVRSVSGKLYDANVVVTSIFPWYVQEQ